MNISVVWKKRFIHTNLTGLSNIVRVDSRIHQIIWFIICIASTLFTAYLIIESILNFMRCQVSTTVRRISPTQLEFPMITLCNRNPLSSDFFLELYNKSKDNISLDKYQHYLLLKLEATSKI